MMNDGFTTPGAFSLISPYGGPLVDLVADRDSAHELRRQAAELPSVRISERTLCDLQLLAVGAFSPLDRFLSRRDFENVVGEMRLADGRLFPIPITLPIEEPLQEGRDIALRGPKNDLLAVMTIEEVFPWDREAVAASVFGTTDRMHPVVAELDRWGNFHASGKLRVLPLAVQPDFRELRRTPAEVRAALGRLGHANVVAFQTRNPIHRAHEELTRRAMEAIGGALLLHPVVGMTKPGDIDQYTRVRTYRETLRHYPRDRVLLALLPLAMRMAGPREALWHAIIRRNYGASHFIVGRDHASPGSDSRGVPFYGPYDAQQLVARHASEIGVTMVPFEELFYLPGEQRYEEASRVPSGTRVLTISGSEVRDRLAQGKPLPEWFTRPEVAAILAESHPPRHRQGFCVWFTGLSGAGKSTTAEFVVSLLLEAGRQVTLLDGDIVRRHLSRGLGFSREDRDANITRIGFVASEIVRHGGAVVCAAISPYRATRESVREMVGADRFLEIFVDTPIQVCEERDPKGMYAQARSGHLKELTGVDDPYEPPPSPELRIETVEKTAEENARTVVERLRLHGFLR